MRGIRGAINVFVALMMIPTIAFTGLMVDFARLQMASVVVNDAADIAVSSAIAYYDGLLKDIYGLWAISQEKDSEGRDVKTFGKEYALASLGLDTAGKKAEKSFNLISAGSGGLFTDSQLGKDFIKTNEKYSLKNTAYFKYEVEQYMKYRVAFSLADVLDGVLGMESSFRDNGKLAEHDREFAENDYKSICGDIAEIDRLYRETYALINDVQGGWNTLKTNTQNRLNTISAKYKEIDENREDPDFAPNGFYVDIEHEARAIKDDVNSYKQKLDDIKAKTAEIDSRTNAVIGKINTAQNKLKNGKGAYYTDLFVGNVSTPVVTDRDDNGVYAQLEFDKNSLIRNLTAPGSNFESSNRPQLSSIKYGSYTVAKAFDRDTYGAAVTINNDVMKNSSEMGGADLVTLNVDSPSVNISLTRFDSGKYDELKAAVEKNKGYSESGINSTIDDYNNKITEYVEKLDVKNIKIPGGYSGWSGSFTNSDTDDGALGNLTVNRLLLTEYGVKMFSNRTTNEMVKDSKKVTGDETLSGVPFAPKVNYMYGTELEYLYWGKDKAQDNYNAVVTTLAVVFAARNLAFTFMDDYIKTEIEAIRCIPYVGWILAEVYRAAIVGLETWRDIDTLTNGKRVPLIKNTSQLNDAYWRCSITYTVNDLSGNSAWKSPYANPGYEGPGMYYYEYLRILVLLNFTADNNELARRLATLVELNINNYKQGIGGCSRDKQLTNLDKFKLKQAYVIADAEIEGKVPFFFISMPFLADRAGGADVNGRTFKVTKTRGY